jgi:hypothetical protein
VMRAHSFTYSWYEYFLSEITKNAKINSFAARNEHAGLLLRHDIDLDLRPALKMGMLENKLNVSSTYFILVCSDFYNPLSEVNRKQLKELIRLGHEIGLHFDPTVYGEADAKRLQLEVEREAKILAEAAEAPIQAVSLHSPSAYGKYPLFDGFINAYDPSIFGDDRYISDSCMNFRGKNPHEWAALARHKTVQCLIHPMHYADDEQTYCKIFCEKICNDVMTIEQAFRNNNCFNKELGGKTLLESLYAQKRFRSMA